MKTRAGSPWHEMSRRTERVASTIHQELAMIMQRELNDPRPAVRVRGDARRHVLQPAHLVGARRVA